MLLGSGTGGWKRETEFVNTTNKQDPRLHLKSAPTHLDGGDERSGDVRPEPRRHRELGHVFFLLHCGCDSLLAKQLQAGNAVLHPQNVQRRTRGQEEARVPVTPAQGGDGALQQTESKGSE